MSEHPESDRDRKVSSAGLNMDMYRRAGGFLGDKFCGAPYPGNPDHDLEPNNFDFHFCRRFPHHDGSDHAAFTFSISVPETWPDVRQL